MKNKFLLSVMTVLIVLFYVLLTAKEINLANSDIGRHLKNGEIVITQAFIPKTNFYSYTNTDFPFYNHHWLSGVIFYLIYRISDFDGLSIFHILVSVLTFYVFFKTAKNYSNPYIVLFASLIALPVFSNRTEIRPEIFSYLFCSIFFAILLNFHYGKIPVKSLYFLPLMQIFWVNLHIYFIFGIFLIAAFLAENVFEYILAKNRIKNNLLLEKIKQISIVFAGVILASLINPYGYKGLLFPFKIFENYGYRVFENQSVWFIEKLFKYPPAINFKILFGILLLSWIFIIYKSILKKEKSSIALFIISIVFSAMGWLAIRNFTIFGYFAFVIISLNLKSLFQKKSGGKFQLITPLVFLVVLFGLYKINPYNFPNKNSIKIGLAQNNDASAKFFIENKLKGPIFNNYDIGSYLIFHLYPGEKVFTDNRPEAYPASFFKEIYIPMQENETVWKSEDEKYKFNTIFFYRHDVTPWAQDFMIKRVFDSQWAVVFVDANSIIFIKRNEQNQDIIKRFELPKEMFKVVKTK